MSKSDEFIPTRQSLLSRIKNWDDQASWREFFDIYWRLIYSVAIKAGLSEAEAEDIVQDTLLAVAKSVEQFKPTPEGSFKGWLLQITRRRIADQIKKRPRERQVNGFVNETATGTRTTDRVEDPRTFDLEASWEEEWQKHILNATLAKLKRQVNPQHYEIYHLHVLKQMPALKVARALKVSLALVYVTKHRLSRLLKKEIHALEAKM